MWYFAKDGAQHGPVPEEELQAMVRDGRLLTADLVWREGMTEWQPVAEVSQLNFTAPVPAPPPVPPPPPYAPPSAYAPLISVPSNTAVPSSPQPYAISSPATGSEIPDYFPWSIAATLLCCLPAGIGAIIYSNKANTAKSRGDLEAARKAADQAKTWLILSVAGGILVVLFILYFQ